MSNMKCSSLHKEEMGASKCIEPVDTFGVREFDEYSYVVSVPGHFPHYNPFTVREMAVLYNTS